MYVLINHTFINTTHVVRVSSEVIEGRWFVIAYMSDRHPVTLSSHPNKDEARKALVDLFNQWATNDATS